MGAMANERPEKWSRIHKTVLLVAWLGWTFDIMDAAIFNLAKRGMVTEVLGNPQRYAAEGPSLEALLLTVFLIGWSAGGLVFGWLSDRYGRLKVLALTILLYSAFTGLTALCHTLPQFGFVRFMTGLGVGGEWAVGAAWVAESVPDKTRAKAASWLQSAATFGPVLAATANLVLAHWDWRALFVFGAFPALLTFVLRHRSFAHETETIVVIDRGPYRPTKALWKTTIAALLLGTAGIGTAQNVTFWLPNFVTAVSQGLANAEIQARQSQALYSLHVGTLIGVFLVPWLCELFGRKKTLLLCFIVSPLSVALVATVAKTFSLLLLTAPLMSVFSIGIGAAFALYFPELFPRAFRAMGAGIAYNGGRIIAAQFSLLTAALIESSRGNVAKSMVQTAFVLAIGGLALLGLPETKGRPLETVGEDFGVPST